MELNRRSFLKGAAMTAVGAVGATALAGCAPSNASDQGTATADGEAYNTAETMQRKWSFEIPPEPIADSDIAETIEADVIVVGAGTSGLMTANSAAEAGLDVVIASASTKPTSRGGSNNAVYCKAFEKEGYPRVPVEQYEKEIFCQTHKVDQRKWYQHYNNSEEAMNWACDLMEKAGYGITIEIGTPDDEDSLYLQRTAAVGWDLNGQTPPEEGLEVVTGKMQPLFVWELARHLEEDLGGKIYYKNVAEQLIREDDNTGRVTAVICKREDDTYAKYVGKKAIVLATGDFSGDRDMMHRFCPETADYVTDDVYDGKPDYDQGFRYGGIFKGQGQKMGLWVGAAWQKSFPNCTMGAYWGPGPRNLYTNHLGLLVDRDGQRFMNENCIGPLASQNIMMLPEKKAFAIWDAGYANYEAVSGDWTNDSMMTGDEAVGKLERVGVFGDDYPTPDGTGVRDYIHVVDLARGHVAALDWMGGKTGTGAAHTLGEIAGEPAPDGTRRGVGIFNLGTGTGSSVLDVVHAFERACGKELPYEIKPRRAGDIAENYAACDKARAELGWTAQYDLDRMCADGWRWQSTNPDGYATA